MEVASDIPTEAAVRRRVCVSSSDSVRAKYEIRTEIPSSWADGNAGDLLGWLVRQFQEPARYPTQGGAARTQGRQWFGTWEFC